jgi:UTP--glucose-1-phosphate uridylyltransferase
MNAPNRNDFTPIRRLLEADDAPDLLIRYFEQAVRRWTREPTGYIREQSIEPAPSLPAWTDLARFEPAGERAIGTTAVIKLNGGLGTSMGLDRAKSLLTVKDELCFLDIIARQMLALRAAHAAPSPLLFMNSFATRRDTLDLLEAYPDLLEGQPGIPLDFVQHRVPKLRAADALPAVDGDDPDLGWCPPGHGDLYTCLQTTGLLDRLLEQGYRYAFVSNADNLGAILDPRILGYLAEQEVPFLMEATRRTVADRKGGHLARDPQGGWLLRESAQCPPEEKEFFQDIERHRYFNTNNLWLNLPALRQALDRENGILPLPLLINRKTLDPRDPASTPVVQLETAMGAALSVIPGAAAIEVPRTRFAPVKTTDDLLALRSDYYQMDDESRLVPHPGRRHPNLDIRLDPAYFKLVDAFETRFAAGTPSLINARSVTVEGDFHFGPGLVFEDTVRLVNQGPDPVHFQADDPVTGERHFPEPEADR